MAKTTGSANKKTYTIKCHVKKVKFGENGITSLIIRPIGKSRIEGMEECCLGWEVIQRTADASDTSRVNYPQVKLFSVEINGSIPGNLVQGLLEAKFHGCEIKIEIKEMKTDGKNAESIEVCGVTLL